MSENDREDKFVENVLSTLDKSARELDPAISNRLRHIRRQALERGTSRVWTGLGPLFRFPAAGLATAAVVLLATFLYIVNPFGNPMQNGFDDAEIIVTNDNLEFYEQLDFYRWLTEEADYIENETRSKNTIPGYGSPHTRLVLQMPPGENEKTGARRRDVISVV